MRSLAAMKFAFPHGLLVLYNINCKIQVPFIINVCRQDGAIYSGQPRFFLQSSPDRMKEG
jgi:hypothetical protein